MVLSLFPDDVHCLPDFSSLLVVGPYHASAPIHLALSYMRENSESRPLLLSPSRTTLKDALANLNDGWLAANSLCGSMIDAVSRIDLLYPPTPVHLSLLLSMLRQPLDGDGDDTLELGMNPKTTRLAIPGLVILHEPSQYFNSALDQHTVSSYTSLIAQTFAALNALSDLQSPPRLVVFDSKLPDLRIPVEITPLPETLEESQTPEEKPPEELLTFVEPFFDTIAIVEDAEPEDVIPSSQGEDISMDEETNTVPRRISFFRAGDEEDEGEDGDEDESEGEGENEDEGEDEGEGDGEGEGESESEGDDRYEDEGESVAAPFKIVHWHEERVRNPQQNDKERTLFHVIV